MASWGASCSTDGAGRSGSMVFVSLSPSIFLCLVLPSWAILNCGGMVCGVEGEGGGVQVAQASGIRPTTTTTTSFVFFFLLVASRLMKLIRRTHPHLFRRSDRAVTSARDWLAANNHHVQLSKASNAVHQLSFIRCTRRLDRQGRPLLFLQFARSRSGHRSDLSSRSCLSFPFVKTALLNHSKRSQQSHQPSIYS